MKFWYRIGSEVPIIRNKFGGTALEISTPAPEKNIEYQDIKEILDLARWAPSGDNSQPWKFEIKSEDSLRIHAFLNPSSVYEYNHNQPSYISYGALIETIGIAASLYGRHVSVTNISDEKNAQFTIDISLIQSIARSPDPLSEYIKDRSVDRGSYKSTLLPNNVLDALENTLGDEFDIVWYTTPKEKRSIIKLNMLATNIRLSIPETFDVHKKIFDFSTEKSAGALPGKSTGLSPLSLFLMEWSLKKWSRVKFLNTFCFGTLAPRLEVDLMPGLKCGGHFKISFKNTKDQYSIEDFLYFGRALQRFWLTAEQLGLVMQPGLAPLAFATHAEQKVPFTTDQRFLEKANTLRDKVCETFNEPLKDIVMLGRIGYPKNTAKNKSRSIRKPIEKLMYQG